MSHFAGQGLEREPFSTSPDPNFLLATRQHATCLQELEISLRLRRGLNVVTGDIGTGKTTLCRSLLKVFAGDPNTDVHLLLDPYFESSEEFLRVILTSVSGVAPDPGMGLWALKEALKQQLFRLGMVEDRLVILVIDEGQKMSRGNLEILREMLNYETNTAKLLQIVIFGQRELEPVLASMPNLTDRINVRRRLSPLTFAETRAMIGHRLVVASGGNAPHIRFTWPAEALIHLRGGGSPRKTVRLCHMAMLEMLVRGRHRVGLAEARAAARPEPSGVTHPRVRAALAATAGLCLVLGGLWLSLGGRGPVLGPGARRTAAAPSAQQAAAAGPTASPAPAGQAPESGPSIRGLTLRPRQDDDAATPAARATLTSPAQDMGPSVRGRIEAPRRDMPQVSAPDARTRAVLRAEYGRPGPGQTGQAE